MGKTRNDHPLNQAAVPQWGAWLVEYDRSFFSGLIARYLLARGRIHESIHESGRQKRTTA